MSQSESIKVRLGAIAALTPLIVHGELQKEQLETVLQCLDVSYSLRFIEIIGLRFLLWCFVLITLPIVSDG